MLKLHTAPPEPLKILPAQLFTQEEAEAILETTHEAVEALVAASEQDSSRKPTKLLLVDGVPASVVD